MAALWKSSEEDWKTDRQIQRLALEMHPDDNRPIWEAVVESRCQPWIHQLAWSALSA